MLILFGLVLFLLGAAFFFTCYRVWLIAEALGYRDPRTIICPETRQWADVRVDGAYAAASTFAGRTQFRVIACSRWPGRQDCAQGCAPQVPLIGDHRRLTQLAPFALHPKFLRVNNPVQMNPALYDRLAPELARHAPGAH